MKLRLQPGSLRLRLSPTEVETLQNTGLLENHIRFRQGEYLHLVLESSSTATRLNARFEESHLYLEAPQAWIQTWATTDQEGMESVQPVEGEEVLFLQVEKDYKCLHKDAQGDETYPHPKSGAVD